QNDKRQGNCCCFHVECSSPQNPKAAINSYSKWSNSSLPRLLDAVPPIASPEDCVRSLGQPSTPRRRPSRSFAFKNCTKSASHDRLARSEKTARNPLPGNPRPG